MKGSFGTAESSGVIAAFDRNKKNSTTGNFSGGDFESNPLSYSGENKSSLMGINGPFQYQTGDSHRSGLPKVPEESFRHSSVRDSKTSMSSNNK
jgi:hypothetical protein